MIYLCPRCAGKGQNKSVYEVEDQVCPDQSIYTPIYRASLRWTEYFPDLEENGEFGDEYNRTIEDFTDVIDLPDTSACAFSRIECREYEELTRSRSVSLASVTSH